jgi:hypothetical protein
MFMSGRGQVQGRPQESAREDYVGKTTRTDALATFKTRQEVID